MPRKYQGENIRDFFIIISFHQVMNLCAISMQRNFDCYLRGENTKTMVFVTLLALLLILHPEKWCGYGYIEGKRKYGERERGNLEQITLDQ